MSRKPKSFDELQAIWYKKLKASGFEDAEVKRGNEFVLQAWHDTRFRIRYRPSDIKATLFYYDQCQTFLNTHAFHNEFERQVWELFCEGFSYREIAAKMIVVHKKLKKDMVNYIINQLQEEMECEKET
jgi:hypothetical protein